MTSGRILILIIAIVAGIIGGLSVVFKESLPFRDRKKSEKGMSHAKKTKET